MYEHGEAKHSKDKVRLVFDVNKGRRHKVAEGEVESPIRRRGEGHGFTTNTERVELWWIDPCMSHQHQSIDKELSKGRLQETGPQVGAKLATNK